MALPARSPMSATAAACSTMPSLEGLARSGGHSTNDADNTQKTIETVIIFVITTIIQKLTIIIRIITIKRI